MELMEKPEFREAEQEGSELQLKAEAFIIIDDATRTEAAEELKRISLRVSQVEALTESPWRSALESYEAVQKWRRDLIARFLGPKKTYAKKIGDWDLAIEQKRRIEAAKAEEKARKDAEDVRRAEIAAAKKAGDKAAAKELQQAPIIPAAPVIKTPAPTKVGGVSTRFKWVLDVVYNPTIVPDEFWVIDESKIQDRIKSLGKNHGIPGVRAKEVPITSGRG